MAQATGTTDTYDLIGLAEDVENIIFNISPMDTPVLTMAKKKSASATNHQWQTDALAAAAANRAIEGDDSTYATAAPTTMLSNRLQISKKSVMVSGTADAVRKYGRAKEFAYQIAKRGKEIKRDMEFAITQNQASSAGGSGTARSSAGLESMIAGNRILPTTSNTGTTPGYSGGDWAAPTDGTATGAGSTLSETYLVQALEAAWTDGGDPSNVVLGSYNKRQVATFGGATKYAGFYNPKQGASQGMVIGGVDLYVSDFGEHKLMLDRFMRARTVLCIDPEYISLAWLRPIHFEERAKTGDATRGELLGEWTLVLDNPDAHAKVQDLFSA